MADQGGYPILRSLRQRWRMQGILFCLLLAVPISLLCTFLLYWWTPASPWYGVLIFGVLLAVSLLLFPYWRISLSDTARWLDRRLPALEESSSLLLRSGSTLGALEKLQAERTAGKLAEIRAPRPLQKKLFFAAGLFGVVFIFCAVVGWRGGRHPLSAGRAVTGAAVVTAAVPKAVLAIQSVQIRVVPPAYTGRAIRQQQEFNLQVEEGSQLNWELHTNMRADHLEFIFNDSLHVALQAFNGEHTYWRLSQGVGRSGFYQLVMDDHLSELYKIEVIHDEAPRIVIKTPKPYTVIELGELRKVALDVRVADDYAVTAVGIVATIASGSGEAVKFKEQLLSFDGGFTGGRSEYALHKTLDLDGLGLKPGDELYFYCRAKDNHGQESRSDMYIISLPDTTQLMSLSGLTTGVDIKPEYFRSERQIIIETEQLLREKDTIPEQAFKNRSNDLGIDQKLLRLRYGKFLGEEAEEGGASEGFSAAPVSPTDFSNAAKVLDAFTDKHDNAEDASFFEPAIKQQLKATLTEMWGAELRLRTFKPQEALPYEYKALRLLKDLQQQSRAFVAKTGVRVTPLDIHKRLTGKLGEIGLPRQHTIFSTEPSPEDVSRMALGLLEQLRGGSGTNAAVNAADSVVAGKTADGQYAGGIMRSRVAIEILQQALRQLGRLASARPGEYLAGYQAMRRILGEGGNEGKSGWASGDLVAAEEAIRRSLPQSAARPFVERLPADGGLAHIYFNQLQNPNQQ